ncbi:MAG: type II toxin-antitoxin system MqsA family antitoxin [Bacteroidota bacterium]
MICLICRQSELVGGLTSIQFARAEMRYVIEHVPAQVCPNCNEAYVEEDVAEKLLRMTEELSATGVFEGVAEYNNPA